MNGERVLERGRMVYAQAAAPDPGGDIKAQTRRVLECIDELLASAGSDKSKLLTAKIRLAHIGLLDEHAAVWNEWLVRERRRFASIRKAGSQGPRR
jgi:enamine deaminase RidA (YjgF/YER057c/UK114 family)